MVVPFTQCAKCVALVNLCYVSGVPVDSSEPNINKRFVGGSLADITNFPHQVLLQYYYSIL
jgi:hypothetical protein